MNTPVRLTDRKREAIVQAAIAAFRSLGFEATSMDRIAADAGVSKRTVYNHFPSKDELFADIMLHMWQQNVAQVNLAYCPEQPLRAQLLELVRLKLKLLEDPHFLDLARVGIAESIHAPERAHAILARVNEREEGMTRWLREAVADGRLKPVDPEFASQQLQGMLKMFAFWPQVTLGCPPLPAEMQTQLAESSVDMFLGYYATAAA
jgi:TetR/AcrR family transcriptional regulator, regulator of autoinduction and epiphytic fitness